LPINTGFEESGLLHAFAILPVGKTLNLKLAMVFLQVSRHLNLNVLHTLHPSSFFSMSRAGLCRAE
jgi:hypothetical protein